MQISLGWQLKQKLRQKQRRESNLLTRLRHLKTLPSDSTRIWSNETDSNHFGRFPVLAFLILTRFTPVTVDLWNVRKCPAFLVKRHHTLLKSLCIGLQILCHGHSNEGWNAAARIEDSSVSSACHRLTSYITIVNSDILWYLTWPGSPNHAQSVSILDERRMLAICGLVVDNLFPLGTLIFDPWKSGYGDIEPSDCDSSSQHGSSRYGCLQLKIRKFKFKMIPRR